MEGPDQDMDELLSAVRQKMTHFIRQVNVQDEPASNAFSGFAIRH
jgi:hypothetical protein